MKHKARESGPCASWVSLPLLMRSDDRVQHLADGALLGLGQRFDLLQLLRDLRLWPALAGASRGRHADQLFDGDAQGAGQRRQHRDRHAALAALVGGDGLLGHVEQPA